MRQMPTLDAAPGSNDTWAKDVQVQTTTKLTTTGGTVWSAAHRCAEFLESEQCAIGLLKPALQVLELGAGCGMLGMLVARNVPAAQVCLTEQSSGGALEHLQLNVQLNQRLPGMCAVTTRACDWTHFMSSQLVEAVRHGTCHRLCKGSLLQQQGISQQQQQLHHRQQPNPTPARQDPECQPKQERSCHPTATLQLQSENHAQHQQQEELAHDLSAAELHDMQELLQTAWDVIIGSDLIYNQAGARGLPKVLAALMGNAMCCKCDTNGASSSNHSAAASSLSTKCSKTDAVDLADSYRCPSCSHANQLQGEEENACVAGMGQSSSSISPDLIQQQQTDGLAGKLGPPQQQKTPMASAARTPGCTCSGPVMYYAHTKHRFDALDVEFFEQLQAHDLDIVEVVEAGRELPPPSPPAFSSLFPDMRIAVFRIAKRQQLGRQ